MINYKNLNTRQKNALLKKINVFSTSLYKITKVLSQNNYLIEEETSTNFINKIKQLEEKVNLYKKEEKEEENV